MSACATPAKGYTPAFLDKLKPKDKRIELADKACPGLRLRLEPSGRKSFVWYYNNAGKNRVKTLGRYGDGESCWRHHPVLPMTSGARYASTWKTWVLSRISLKSA